MVDIRGSATRGRPEPRPTPPPVISPLTGIRAIAALAVVVFHFREPLFALLPAAHRLDPWLMFGFLGVDVFFVLSGFIISYNYAERLAVLTRRGYGSFLRARFARVYPVHLFTFLLAAALLFAFAVRGAALNAGQDHTVLGFVGNVFLLQALPGIEPWNGASWSVSCEAAAYLVFPLAAAFLHRLGRRAALALGAVVVVLQLAAIEVLSALPGFFPFNWVRLSGEFTLGCLLWAAWRHGVRGGSRWDLAALAAVVMALVLFSIAKPWLAIPFLALFVVSAASASGPVRAFLASRPMEWGGRVSYSLFLVHIPVIVLMFLVLPPDRFSVAPLPVRLTVLAAYGVAMVTAAAATYYGIEEPCRAWIRRRRGLAGPDEGRRTSGETTISDAGEGVARR